MASGRSARVGWVLLLGLSAYYLSRAVTYRFLVPDRLGPDLHLAIGKLYVAGAIVGALTAIGLGATIELEGSRLPIVLLGLLWLFFTLAGWRCAVTRNYDAHRLFMTRSYGLARVLGESGTGKELIASAIHEASPRAGRPLVAVNCASIPAELFESEFFGHRRGAFTGATSDRPGRFQVADGGTLLLDEVGEIPLELQGKLLRALQEGEFSAVGSDQVQRVDVRVVAATNRDLRAEVKAGRFREDLYYRLAVFPLELPPLRERRQDIPELAGHFLRQIAARRNSLVPMLRHRDMLALQQYDWPGNVRELQNVIERAVILGHIDRNALGLESGGPAPVRGGRVPSATADTGELMTEDERRALMARDLTLALQRTGGRVAGPEGAAALLGLKPTTFRSRMKALGLDRSR